MRIKNGSMSAVVLMVLLCLLSSCGHHISEGVVVSKKYEPARSYVIMQPILVGKMTTLIPITYFDDEDFILYVQGITEEGEEKKESFYVTKAMYEETKKGDTVCFRNDNMDHGDSDRVQ
jgi:hypothetical protein